MTTPDPTEHYFSAEPAGALELRRVDVMLRGHPVSVTTAGATFSPGRVDLGTRVLLRDAPGLPPSGHLLDLGCGWGPLALAMGLESPHADVWAVDVNTRAVALTGANAGELGLSRVRACLPADIPAELEFAAIWSNPPIRIGKEPLHALLLEWLPRLAPGASAFLVVQRNLGADSLHAWLRDALTAYDVSRLGSAKGYRVLEVRRPE